MADEVHDAVTGEGYAVANIDALGLIWGRVADLDSLDE